MNWPPAVAEVANNERSDAPSIQSAAELQVPTCPASRPHDAVIVGGGLAGSALAIQLATARRDVVLIEKSTGAHAKVCGEFLSHEALHYLTQLGIDPEALGAVPIEAVRLTSGRTSVSCKLPFRALSLSRELLDEAMLARASEAGARVIRGHRVETLQSIGATWHARLHGGEDVRGRDAFLATGKHDLYGWNRPAGKHRDLLAFKMYWRLSAAQTRALEGSVELMLFPGGYAGLQPVENGRANLCLLVSRSAFCKVGSRWPALLAHIEQHSPHLSLRLASAEPLWSSPLTLSSIPYGHVQTTAASGLWRLGDQSAVIPSFSGDGMSIALHSAGLAAQIYCRGGSANHFQQRLAKHVAGQVRFATLLSRALIHMPGAAAVAAVLWPGLLAAVATLTRIRRNQIFQGSHARA